MNFKSVLVLSVLMLILLQCDRPGLAPAEFRTLTEPRNYVCYLSPDKIKIDGVISDAEWGDVPWSEDFSDIEGDVKPEPAYYTRVKILWDPDYLYVAAELEEPHVWATITERDEVIFYDNDFEVFIDPDGDTHLYYELEINAFSTLWDLLLIKPYRDGGPAVNGWDIPGLLAAVKVQGSVNDPSDQDVGWTIEIAIPMSALEECSPAVVPPKNGTHWRINFSRVEWQTEIVDGQYSKIVNPSTGKPFPEYNWVWAPQGHINMHMPEFWGILQFSTIQAGLGKADFQAPEDLKSRWIIRQIYTREHEYFRRFGIYTSRLRDLGFQTAPVLEAGQRLELHAGPSGFTATISSEKPFWSITIFEDSRVVIHVSSGNEPK